MVTRHRWDAKFFRVSQCSTNCPKDPVNLLYRSHPIVKNKVGSFYRFFFRSPSSLHSTKCYVYKFIICFPASNSIVPKSEVASSVGNCPSSNKSFLLHIQYIKARILGWHSSIDHGWTILVTYTAVGRLSMYICPARYQMKNNNERQIRRRRWECIFLGQET